MTTKTTMVCGCCNLRKTVELWTSGNANGWYFNRHNGRDGRRCAGGGMYAGEKERKTRQDREVGAPRSALGRMMAATFAKPLPADAFKSAAKKEEEAATRAIVKGALRAAMEKGVEFIAYNDEPSSLSVKEVAGFISTITLSEVTGYSARAIARRVVEFRKAHPF